MSTIDTSTWSPDSSLNTDIGGIPLNADAGIAQTWQAIRILMAAVKGDGDAIKSMIDVMRGATASADGASGLVPAPEAGDQDKFLKGDGAWGMPTDTTYSEATSAAAGLMSAADKAKLDGLGTVFIFCGSVAAASSLPSSGNVAGDVYAVESPASVYVWDGSAWVELGFGDALVPATDADIDALFS